MRGAEGHGQQHDGRNGQEHQDHPQLAQGMPALAPPDGRLGQEVAAEDDGAEHDGLAGHRDGGIRTAVGEVESRPTTSTSMFWSTATIESDSEATNRSITTRCRSGREPSST